MWLVNPHSIQMTLKEHSADLALHFHNTVAHWNDWNEIKATELDMSFHHVFIFPIERCLLHYP